MCSAFTEQHDLALLAVRSSMVQVLQISEPQMETHTSGQGEKKELLVPSWFKIVSSSDWIVYLLSSFDPLSVCEALCSCCSVVENYVHHVSCLKIKPFFKIY